MNVRLVGPKQPRGRFTADEWNAFARGANYADGRMSSIATETKRRYPDHDSFLIRNDSGVDIPNFGVLGLSAPLITPGDHLDRFKFTPNFAGVTPYNPNHFGRFAVVQQPLEYDQSVPRIGRACVDGVTPAYVDVTDEDHVCCDVKNGSVEQLQSYECGSAAILTRTGGTGPQWCLIRLGVTCPEPGEIPFGSGAIGEPEACWATFCDTDGGQVFGDSPNPASVVIDFDTMMPADGQVFQLKANGEVVILANEGGDFQVSYAVGVNGSGSIAADQWIEPVLQRDRTTGSWEDVACPRVPFLARQTAQGVNDGFGSGASPVVMLQLEECESIRLSVKLVGEAIQSYVTEPNRSFLSIQKHCCMCVPVPLKADSEGSAVVGFSLLLIYFADNDPLQMWQDTTGLIEVALVGDPVGLLEDASGEANDADQATDDDRPTYQTDVINGESTLLFDGVNDNLDLPDAVAGTDLSAKAGATIMAVVKRVGIGAIMDLVDLSINGTNSKLRLRFTAADKVTVGARAEIADSLQEVTTDDAVPATPVMITGQVDLAGDAIDIRFNGHPQSVTGTPSWTKTAFDADTGTAHRLGSSNNDVNFYDGHLGQIRLYQDPLATDANRDQTEFALSSKFGLPYYSPTYGWPAWMKDIPVPVRVALWHENKDKAAYDAAPTAHVLQHWWDAADPANITESSTQVSQWTDRIGNVNATQAGADSAKPGISTAGGLDTILFDGVGEYLSITYSDLAASLITSEASLASWIWLNGTGYQRVFEHFHGNHTANILDYNGSAWYSLWRPSAAASAAYDPSYATTPTTGQWYHVATTWKPASFVKVYVDGVLVATDTSGRTSSGTVFRAAIGCRNPSSPDRFLDAHLHHLQLYSATLTNEEIAALHGSTGPNA